MLLPAIWTRSASSDRYFCDELQEKDEKRMKIILSEKYGRLASWMRKLPAQGVCGEVLRDDRNTLWCERVAGEEFVVKRFAVPLRLNRWVYTFFRPTKARRMTIRCGSGGRASPWPIRSVTSSAGGGCCSIQATMFPNGFPTRRSNSWIENRRHGSSRFSMPLRPSPSASTKRVCSITTTIRATSSITGRTVRGISR